MKRPFFVGIIIAIALLMLPSVLAFSNDSVLLYSCYNGTFNDASSNGFDLISMNGALPNATGKYNSSCYTDGSNDYIMAPNQTALEFEKTQNFSVFMWFKTPDCTASDAGENRFFQDQQVGGNNAGWFIQTYSSYTNSVMNYQSSSKTAQTATPYCNNVWNYIGITNNGTSNNLSLYVNGTTVASSTATITGDIAQNNNNITLGRRGSGYGENYYERIVIFNKTLSPSEVSSLFADNGSITFAPPPSANTTYTFNTYDYWNGSALSGVNITTSNGTCLTAAGTCTLSSNESQGALSYNATLANYYVANGSVAPNSTASIPLWQGRFTVRAVDLFDNSNVSGVNITVDGGSSALTNSSGVASFAGLYNGTVSFNASKSLYYNLSGVVAVNSSANASMYQAVYRNVSVRRLLANDSVAYPYNITVQSGRTYLLDGSDVPVYLRAGATNLTFNKTGYYGVVQNYTVTAQTNTTAELSGAYDNRYSFNASDTWNNVSVQNYSLVVSNGSLGGQLYNVSTSNGSIVLNLLQGYSYDYQFTVPNDTYERVNVSLAANASSQNYTFSVLPAPAISITIRDSSSGAVITENMTITITGNTTGITVNTTSGTYFAQNLTPGQYVIKFENANYSQTTYTVTATQGAVYYLTAYLQRSTNDLILQTVDSIATAVVIPDAQITQQAVVNGTWQTVSTRFTDITGRTTLLYQDGVEYRFIIIADGYETKTFSLDPVLYSSYQIQLRRTTTLDFNQDFQSAYISYTPSIFTNGQANALNITFSSPAGIFTSYNYTVRYPGGNLSGGGNNAVGENFALSFNITGANYTSRVNISLTYAGAIGGPRTFNYSNLILISPGSTTMIANKDNTYGLGLFERLLFGTIVMLLAVGLITLGAGPIWGLGFGLFIMGWWIKIGFWPWWAAGISFLVGFAVLAGRTD